MEQKYYFNAKHQPRYIKVSNEVVLRLHHDYDIPLIKVLSKKLTQQYTSPWTVTEVITPLSYRLDTPESWKINPVFIILQLKPWNGQDPFNRSNPDVKHPKAVYVEGDTEKDQPYKLKRIIGKRVRLVRGKTTTEYLVRWRGYSAEYNT